MRKKEMSIYDALAKLPQKRRVWFNYLFPEFYSKEKKLTIEDAIRQTGIHSAFPILRWKQSDEFNALCALALAAREADDLLQIYNAVKAKAVKGDEKSVKLMLTLQHEIELHKKSAIALFQGSGKKDDPYDDLD